MSTTDRIEKKVHLRATRSRVWRALTDAREFSAWFGVKLEGSFVLGQRIRGKLTIPGYDHLTLELDIERLEPERLFSYRWHPYAVDATVDYASEPTTLVEMTLDADKEGTLLTIVESGFDKIPLARRGEAFRMNDQGWTGQMANIERHVAAA